MDRLVWFIEFIFFSPDLEILPVVNSVRPSPAMVYPQCFRFNMAVGQRFLTGFPADDRPSLSLPTACARKNTALEK